MQTNRSPMKTEICLCIPTAGHKVSEARLQDNTANPTGYKLQRSLLCESRGARCLRFRLTTRCMIPHVPRHEHVHKTHGSNAARTVFPYVLGTCPCLSTCACMTLVEKVRVQAEQKPHEHRDSLCIPTGENEVWETSLSRQQCY